MEEWDEFLSVASVSMESVSTARDSVLPSVATDEPPQQIQHSPVHAPSPPLEEFADNAEVLIQLAQGESSAQLANGIWISKGTVPVAGFSARKSPSQTAKRPIMSHGKSPATVPVANSLQDLGRALDGHPLLSHPLSLMRRACISPCITSLQTATLTEVGSLGLFFYGGPKTVQVETDAVEDFDQIIRLKHVFAPSNTASLLSHEPTVQPLPTSTLPPSPAAHMTISLDNLKTIVGALPPHGKPAWMLPFSVTAAPEGDGRTHVDLSRLAIASPSATSLLAATFDYYTHAVRERVTSVPSRHRISLDETLLVDVLTQTPVLSVALHFRGALHLDPAHSLVESLFCNEPNFQIELDAELAQIRACRVHVPRFDGQSRMFALLKGLHSMLSVLPPSDNYHLVHLASTPILKIVCADSGRAGSCFDLSAFCSQSKLV